MKVLTLSNVVRIGAMAAAFQASTAFAENQCGRAAFYSYCSGVATGLSVGAEKSNADLSTALKVKSAQYTSALDKLGPKATSERYLKQGVQDASKSQDSAIMERLLKTCVSDDKPAMEKFIATAETSCSQ